MTSILEVLFSGNVLFVQSPKDKRKSVGPRTPTWFSSGTQTLSSFFALLSSLPSFYLKFPSNPANALFPLSTLGEYSARMIVDEVGNGRREAKQRRKCVGKRKGEVKAAANDGRDGVLAQVVCQCGSNGSWSNSRRNSYEEPETELRQQCYLLGSEEYRTFGSKEVCKAGEQMARGMLSHRLDY